MSDDYKETLNLPQTEFPMRGNLPEREPTWLRLWQDLDVHGAWTARHNAETFVLHDGPPYANGDIHIGHALNKILKDIAIKVQALRGKRTPYIPGWDCHGLPIEAQVTKQLGAKAHELSDAEFRRECRAYAETYVQRQRDAFMRLGVIGDWQRPYRTMDFAYEAQTLRSLADLVERGYVFRRRKPVAWSIANRTALAEAELEYHDREDPSVYVRFDVAANDLPKTLGTTQLPTALAIWTTTPWTLPANLAVAVHPEVEYGLYTYELNNRRAAAVLAVALGEAVLAAAGARSMILSGTCYGRDLVGLTYSHPFCPRSGRVVAAEFVTTADGTGLVHIAPGHGADDYEVGLREGLDIYSPVNGDGRYDNSVPDWLQGMDVWTANDRIVQQLRQSGHLLYEHRFTHSYPHDWRSQTPIIFRATHQWFIGMANHNLRKRALKAIDAVHWTPSWGSKRIRGMVEARPDWCISRQRRWGVPIALPICRTCNEPILDHHVMRRVADRFATAGADIWFEAPLSEFLPPDYTCPTCGGSDLDKETDILDVWFDSGISWAAVLAQHPDLKVPADLYLEGSDQHRGWFQSSLLLATALIDKAPYRNVVTAGFVVDSKGRKMSKSLGNVIDPAKIIQQYGADILRLWVASEIYEDDMRIGDEILKRIADAYRRIRNTFRFLLGNLYDFEPQRDSVAFEALEPYDAYMLHRLHDLKHELLAAYDAYQYHHVFHKLVQFMAVDLSARYLDVAKDRLYTDAATGHRRRSAQTVIYHLAESLALMVAPILSFTAEEVWQLLPGDRAPSVLLATITTPHRLELGESRARAWETMLAVREAVLPALESARAAKQIGHSLDAKVCLAGRGEVARVLEAHRDFLAEWLIVSQTELVDWDTPGLTTTAHADLKLAVEQPEGRKCSRCWRIQPEVGRIAEYPELCRRCADVLTV